MTTKDNVLALPVVAYLPASHAVSCATLDPDAGRCDCGAQRITLVRQSDAQAFTARLLAEQGGEPFGYWHQGETEEESDFHLASVSGDVACEHCIALYAHPEPNGAERKALTDEQCREIYEELDSFAQDIDHYDLGLPMLDVDDRKEVAFALIRKAVGIPAPADGEQSQKGAM